MPKKFFAVALGRKRGIYNSYAECFEQVRKFHHSRHKTFFTKEDAQAYVDAFAHIPDGTPPDPELLKFWDCPTSRTTQAISSEEPDSTEQLLTSNHLNKNSFANQGKETSPSVPRAKKRSGSQQDGPNFKVARKSSSESWEPQTLRIHDRSNKNAEPESSKKECDKSKKKLQRLKVELERLKEKQTKMEDDILKIVQHIQEKTDGMEILKAEIAAVERQVSMIEAGKPSSLKEAVSRIGIFKENRPEEKVERSKLQPPIVKTEPAVTDEAEPVESKEEKEIPISDFSYDDDNHCIVYTAGVCLNEGQDNIKAGLGVFFGDGNKYNMSEPLGTECPPSNNNAAIVAAILACNVAKLSDISKININIDSNFLRRCGLVWIPKWETKGWKSRFKGQTVTSAQKNQIRRLWNAMKGLEVKWTYFPPDSNGYGNKMASQLALEGAEKYEGSE